MIRQMFVSFAIATSCLVPRLLNGQGPAATLIPDALSCAKCSITTRQVARLQPGDGPGVIDRTPFSVRVDSRGRYWVISEQQLPLVFGPDGRFLKLVGRKGQGPGEFVWVTDVLPVSGDSVLVLDGTARRATVVGPDLEPGRMIRLTAPLRGPALVTWPNTVVMSGSAYSEGGKGYPLHRVSFAKGEAEIAASFGTETYNVSPYEMDRMFKLVGPAKTGVWSSEQLRYRFASWARDGTPIGLFERKPEWFSKTSEGYYGNRTTPPPPTVSAIHEDESGLLWVFVRVAANTWREGWPAMKPGQREVAMKDMRYDKFFRTMVEVIDPLAGRVVARHSLNEYVMAALPGRRAAVYGATADAEPFVSIISLTLNGR